MLGTAPTTAAKPGTTGAKPPSPGHGPALAGWVVVVDPGHNGENALHTTEINRPVDAGGVKKACNTTGTEGDDGWPEADFTWAMAGELRSKLEAAGATVVLTRNDNNGWGPCVDQRGLTAGRVHARVLISLHADGASASAHGFHVIHPGPVAGYTDGTWGDSARLATLVRDDLVASGRTPATYVGTRGLNQRNDLATLNRSAVPSVMLELGNMRNAGDLADLHDPVWRAVTADAITKAVADYAQAG